MDSSWVLLIALSLLILMGFTNAASTGQRSWEGIGGDEEVPKVPKTLSPHMATPTEEPFKETSPHFVGHQPQSLPEYHPNYPTDVVVRFAELKKHMRIIMRAIQLKSKEIDTRITELIKGNITDIHQNTEDNNEAIKVETESRIAELRRVEKFIEDQIRLVKEDVVEIKSDLQKLRLTIESNKGMQDLVLQEYWVETNKEVQEFKKELNNHFVMTREIQKNKFNKRSSQRLEIPQ